MSFWPNMRIYVYFCRHLAVSTSTTKMSWDNQIRLLYYARSQTTYQRQEAVDLAPHIEILEFLFHALLGICQVNFIKYAYILMKYQIYIWPGYARYFSTMKHNNNASEVKYQHRCSVLFSLTTPWRSWGGSEDQWATPPGRASVKDFEFKNCGKYYEYLTVVNCCYFPAKLGEAQPKNSLVTPPQYGNKCKINAHNRAQGGHTMLHLFQFYTQFYIACMYNFTFLKIS
jgi:hypothetical protein